MIEFVETPHGLMPKPVWQRMQAQKAAAEKKFRASIAGIRADKVARAAVRARKTLGPAVMNQLYPCRSCKVIRDEKYGERCARERVKPCFLVKHYRGCANWKPLPVVA